MSVLLCPSCVTLCLLLNISASPLLICKREQQSRALKDFYARKDKVVKASHSIDAQEKVGAVFRIRNGRHLKESISGPCTRFVGLFLGLITEKGM